MKAYVINLDKDQDRLTFMSERLHDLGVSFERIPAIYGRDIGPAIIEWFRRPRADGVIVRWKAEEVGCFLSHVEAWKRIATGEDSHGLILEDDIYIADDVKGFLDHSSWIPLEVQIIRFEASTSRLLFGDMQAAGTRHIAPLKSTSWCAGAYILSRDTAQMLLAQPDTMYDHVDAYLFSYERSPLAKQLRTWQVVPALCIQDKFLNRDKRFVSNIEHKLDQKSPFGRVVHWLVFYSIPALIKTIKGYRRVSYQP